jgi:hypothetical protein
MPAGWPTYALASMHFSRGSPVFLSGFPSTPYGSHRLFSEGRCSWLCLALTTPLCTLHSSGHSVLTSRPSDIGSYVFHCRRCSVYVIHLGVLSAVQTVSPPWLRFSRSDPFFSLTPRFLSHTFLFPALTCPLIFRHTHADITFVVLVHLFTDCHTFPHFLTSLTFRYSAHTFLAGCVCCVVRQDSFATSHPYLPAGPGRDTGECLLACMQTCIRSAADSLRFYTPCAGYHYLRFSLQPVGCIDFSRVG